MSKAITINPKTDFVLERVVDAPRSLVWEALTNPEHMKAWYMPKAWGAVTKCELELQPGGTIRVDIRVNSGQEVPNLGCVLEVVPQERLVYTAMLFPGYRPAVFDDIPFTAIVTLEDAGAGTRYVFTALHRSEEDFKQNRESGWEEGTQIAADQFVAHVASLK